MKGNQTMHVAAARQLNERYMETVKAKQSTLEKLNLMYRGTLVVMTDDELDTLCEFDVSNVIRTRPNPDQVGTLDRWEAWIEKRDLARFNP